jgi:hypothetical protein
MDNDYQWLHGRVDAGIEENFNLVESVPVKIPAREELQQRNLINASREGTPFHSGVPLPGMYIRIITFLSNIQCTCNFSNPRQQH